MINLYIFTGIVTGLVYFFWQGERQFKVSLLWALLWPLFWAFILIIQFFLAVGQLIDMFYKDKDKQ